MNGGYFVFRREIFDALREGEDLVDGPFSRLVRRGALQARLYDGFWKNMDTFKDKQALDELCASGKSSLGSVEGVRRTVIELALNRDPKSPLGISVSRGHSDDIEIGCGGTVLRLLTEHPGSSVHWVVFSADRRTDEARRDSADVVAHSTSAM